MSKVTIVIDCLNAERRQLEGYSGNTYGIFEYDAERTKARAAFHGGGDSVCSIRMSVKEFRKIRNDILNIPRRSSYPNYLVDVEIEEDAPAEGAASVPAETLPTPVTPAPEATEPVSVELPATGQPAPETSEPQSPAAEPEPDAAPAEPAPVEPMPMPQPPAVPVKKKKH